MAASYCGGGGRRWRRWRRWSGAGGGGAVAGIGCGLAAVARTQRTSTCAALACPPLPAAPGRRAEVSTLRRTQLTTDRSQLSLPRDVEWRAELANSEQRLHRCVGNQSTVKGEAVWAGHTISLL